MTAFPCKKHTLSVLNYNDLKNISQEQILLSFQLNLDII